MLLFTLRNLRPSSRSLESPLNTAPFQTPRLVESDHSLSLIILGPLPIPAIVDPTPFLLRCKILTAIRDNVASHVVDLNVVVVMFTSSLSVGARWPFGALRSRNRNRSSGCGLSWACVCGSFEAIDSVPDGRVVAARSSPSRRVLEIIAGAACSVSAADGKRGVLPQGKEVSDQPGSHC